MRRTVNFIGLCLALTIGLYGCGGSTSADSVQAGAAEKTAIAKFSVAIPQVATKSLIPSSTANGGYVYVSWYGYDATTGAYAPGELYLYPDATTGKATGSAELIPGIYGFTASCYSAAGAELSTASSYAWVSSGTNDIVITFLQGRWTFVDAAGNSAPITLTSKEVLNSFDLQNYYSGSDQYDLIWNLGSGSTIVSSLDYQSISGNLSEMALLFGQSLPSGVLATATHLDMLSTTYNLTQQSTGGTESPGDHVFMFTSIDPGNSQLAASPLVTHTLSPSDASQYFNTQITSGTKITGTLIEYVVGSETSMTPTGKSCTFTYQMPKLAKLPSRVSKASLIGTVTDTYTICEPTGVGTAGAEYQSTTTYNSVNVYPFIAIGSELAGTIAKR